MPSFDNLIIGCRSNRSSRAGRGALSDPRSCVKLASHSRGHHFSPTCLHLPDPHRREHRKAASIRASILISGKPRRAPPTLAWHKSLLSGQDIEILTETGMANSLPQCAQVAPTSYEAQGPRKHWQFTSSLLGVLRSAIFAQSLTVGLVELGSKTFRSLARGVLRSDGGPHPCVADVHSFHRTTD